MNVEWPDGRCVLCQINGDRTPERDLTVEHIIPRAIGGVLTSRLLCKACNELVGAHEAKLKDGPALRLAIEKVRDQIPSLYERMSLRQEFVAQSSGGAVEGYCRREPSTGHLEFRVRRSQAPDGSLLAPTDEARDILAHSLRGEGLSEAGIDEALRKFDEASEDDRVTVAPGMDIIKRTVLGIGPKLDGRLLLVGFDPGGAEFLQGAGISLLKAAFEFLALHLGAQVFSSALDPIRNALLKNDASLSPHRIEWKRGTKLEPYHGLVIEPKQSHIVVQIRLFGELVYRVHFNGLIAGSEFRRCMYRHDLIENTEHFKELHSAAAGRHANPCVRDSR